MYDIIKYRMLQTLTTDPTAAAEQKIQNLLRKIKSKFSEQEYKRLYPTGSAPARFYGTAKIHKLKNDRGVDEQQYDLLSPTIMHHHTNLKNI